MTSLASTRWTGPVLLALTGLLAFIGLTLTPTAARPAAAAPAVLAYVPTLTAQDTALAAAFPVPTPDPAQLCGVLGPMAQALCEAAKAANDASGGQIVAKAGQSASAVVGGAAQSIASGTPIGPILSFLQDPSGTLTRSVTNSYLSIAKFLNNDTATTITQPTILKLYGMVGALALMISVGHVIVKLGFTRDLLQQLWALPGWFFFVISLGAVPLLFGFGVNFVDAASAPFISMTGPNMGQTFANANGVFSGLPGILGIDKGFGLAEGMLLAFLGSATVLFFELILRTGILYVLLIFYPLFALGLIHPKDSGERNRLMRWIDVSVAVLASKAAVVIILALAGGLLANATTAHDKLVAIGLLFLVVFAPLALLAFLPLTEAAGIGRGLGSMLRAPVARAGRFAGRVATAIK